MIPGKRAPSTASTRWKFPGFSSSPSSDTVSVLESGSSLFEKANKYKIPAIAIKIPTFPSSNIVKPSYPASRIMPCTTRFVEVPIKVHIPPNIVTYERGIKNFVAGSLTASAHRLMIGAKITTTGVLFRNADTKATGGSILACALKTVVFPSGSSFLINWPKAPLCRTPSLTRKSMATVIIPLLLKPSSISLGVRMPTQRKNTTTVRRTIPGRILSHTKAAIMPIRASNTNTISKFIYLLLRAQK